MIVRRAMHGLSTMVLCGSALLGCAQAPATTTQPRTAHAPTTVQARATEAASTAAIAFDAAQVARGAQLSAIGNCRVCHTQESGPAFAGGRPLPTPFGTVYSTNITPDPQTGIGRWSLDDFRRALHEGIDRAGHRLYPVFPYDHFTRVTDDDVDALYAFIMTRKPVSAHTPGNRLRFPASVRPLLAAWQWLYLDDRRFIPDPQRSAEWNRGAYLVEGLGHCGACHTPRNVAGAEKKHRRFQGGEAERWDAPGLRAASPAPMPWGVDALFRYLRHGFDADHGLAVGPMAPVVDGLATIPEADVRAIATYVASLPGKASVTPQSEIVAAAVRREFDPLGEHSPDRASEASDDAARTEDAGEIIFAGACATCHFAGNALPDVKPVPLALATSVNASTPRNTLQIVLGGLHPEPGQAGPIMPGFRGALTDAQIVAVVQYVRARFSDRPRWTQVADTLRSIEQENKR